MFGRIYSAQLDKLTIPPWYVIQPCKFVVDFELSDEELIQYTENKIKNLSGYSIASEWKKSHKNSLGVLGE